MSYFVGYDKDGRKRIVEAKRKPSGMFYFGSVGPMRTKTAATYVLNSEAPMLPWQADRLYDEKKRKKAA